MMGEVTVEWVRERVEYIRRIADDDEAAHSREDDLHRTVLEAIMNGAENPAELAKEALKTIDIDFSRWCA